MFCTFALYLLEQQRVFSAIAVFFQAFAFLIATPYSLPAKTCHTWSKGYLSFQTGYHYQ